MFPLTASGLAAGLATYLVAPWDLPFLAVLLLPRPVIWDLPVPPGAGSLLRPFLFGGLFRPAPRPSSFSFLGLGSFLSSNPIIADRTKEVKHFSGNIPSFFAISGIIFGVSFTLTKASWFRRSVQGED